MVILSGESLLTFLLLLHGVMIVWSSPSVLLEHQPPEIPFLSHFFCLIVSATLPCLRFMGLVIWHHISSDTLPPAENSSAHPAYYLFSVLDREYRDDQDCSFIALHGALPPMRPFLFPRLRYCFNVTISVIETHSEALASFRGMSSK